MAEPRSAAEEAGDPSTAPERLIELTESRPQLHRLLVLNPSTPEVAREWILATDPWAREAYDAHRAAGQDAADEDEGPATEEHPVQRPRLTPTSAPAWEDIPDEPVWGDFLGASTPLPAGPDQSPILTPPSAESHGVRIADTDAVVPLGPAPSVDPTPTAAMPIAAHPDSAPARPEEPAEGSRRRGPLLWGAGLGCLLLAIVLLLAAVFAGRALLGGNEEAAPSPTTAATTEEPTDEATTPSEEPTTAEETTPPDPVSPAPEGAIELRAIASPTGNITCSLSEDSVGCTLGSHDFSGSGSADCDDDAFSIGVSESEARLACGSTYGGPDAQTLEYGESAIYGDMACTSRSTGMTCWNTMTGKGFMVNRASYTTI
ncbi:hypothetical protein [Brachybacterium sp. YJGR34]|uniref:variant leucine-rich repeat-containing protein n=1 Tax=Brachybacterium sp. YJGR34 TaxID=2059911 RepID=UPI000E0A36DA|nr:hypothetical protein [Brachybacterium sp. YJGR34]